MGILNKTGYSYQDLTVVPKTISEINSRSECKPYYLNGFLPIFTAPMSCVVSVENFEIWKDNNIIPILPRTVKWEDRLKFLKEGEWVAVGLEEFKKLLENKPDTKTFTMKVLLDIANGHIKSVIELCREAKDRFGSQIEIMAGNIANPETYIDYCEAKIDYVRCSVGSGAGCLTTSNTGIHYPIATLIDEVRKIKDSRECDNRFCTKIIADGGIRNYSDVIKALALGADYVMIGGLFSSLFESAALPISNFQKEDSPNVIEFKDMYYCSKDSLVAEILSDWRGYMPQYKYEWIDGEGYDVTFWIKSYIQDEKYKRGFLRRLHERRQVLVKEFYGMSTKKAQSLMGKDELKTSEG